MTRRPLLRIEQLEDRVVPSSSVWGTPWPDGQFLTLSLAPTGTNISGTGSNLSSVLSEAGPGAEQALLQAFQTWADVANINFGLVADGGEAFGVARAIQDDPRFGDIRIGAIPIASDVVAVTSPFDYFNTYSGDVVLNSSQPIGSTYNLYTVALHEAGHALGLPDNNDPNSVMYEYYTGANTSLDANDIAAIQSLYGPRPANSTNNSFATALSYNGPVFAQLSTPTDVDYYKFTTPLLLPGPTTIHLQTEGLSLLDATVSVYNSRGGLVASTTATNPASNDLTLTLNGGGLIGLSTYYVMVNSPNGGVFDVGSYDLTVTTSSLLGDVLGGVLGLLGDVGHTLASATNLTANSTALDGEVNYNARAGLNSGKQTDYYAVQAPASSSGSEDMVATIWSLTNQSLTPRVQVFNDEGNPVAFQVLTATGGDSTIQVVNAVPGQTYKLEVTSGADQTGNYSLSVSYLSAPIVFPLSASGTLNSSQSSASATLTVPVSQFMHFVLSAGAVPSDPDTLVMMTITDGNGNTVATLETTAGNSESLDVLLGAGTYTVTVSETTSNGSALPPIAFTLDAIGITDPVGVAAQNPSSNPTGGGSTGSGSTGSGSTGSSGSTTTSSTSGSSWTGTSPSSSSTFN